MKVDIVCPLYKAENLIEGFLQRLAEQEGIEIGKAVFPITESEGMEKTAEIIEKAGYTWFAVKKEEFSHSLTREKAVMEYCESEVVVMMSEDVIPQNPNSIKTLAEAVDEKVVYAYGRQICKNKSIERYIRNKNYGEQSQTVCLEDVEKLQLKAFFSSDAFSAYHRPTFVELGGYDGVHMMMSEDMYYAKKIIEKGYFKAYVAEAVVEHSHKFTLKQLYKRYYETGKWFAEHPEFDGYKTTDSGLKLALYVFGQALKHFNLPVLIKFIPNMTARLLGMKKGKKHYKGRG